MRIVFVMLFAHDLNSKRLNLDHSRLVSVKFRQYTYVDVLHLTSIQHRRSPSLSPISSRVAAARGAGC